MCNVDMLLTRGFHRMHQEEEDASAVVEEELTTQYISPLSIPSIFALLLFSQG